MDVPGQIVPPVTVKAKILLPVTLATPVEFDRSPVGMLMRPVGRMYIHQSQALTVTERAIVFRLYPIMTVQANAHLGHMFFSAAFTPSDVAMAQFTL